MVEASALLFNRCYKLNNFIMNFAFIRLLPCSIIKLKNANLETKTVQLLHKYFCHSVIGRAYRNDTESLGTTDNNFEENVQNSEIDFDKLTGGNPEKVKKLKKLELEIYMIRQKGDNVPSHLTSDQWTWLLSVETYKGRRDYLKRLWLKEVTKKDEKKQKIINSELFAKKKLIAAKEELVKISTRGPIIYNIKYNNIFFRITDSRIDKFYNYKLFQAMMFGPPFLIDCSQESYLSLGGKIACANEIRMLWSKNRNCGKPYHLIFCNLIPTSILMQQIRKVLPKLEEPHFPFFYSSECVGDLYPKEKLVYLTSKTRVHLRRYNPDDIYILDCIDYFTRNDSLLHAKAKIKNIRLAKLPFNANLNWCTKGTYLRPVKVLSIMESIKNTPEWNFSFRKMATAKQSQKTEK